MSTNHPAPPAPTPDDDEDEAPAVKPPRSAKAHPPAPDPAVITSLENALRNAGLA